jgi:predicted enzyme related to lactoylglutathione lyase
LTETADYPSAADVRNPHLGWVEVKAHDLHGQRRFYGELMGLREAAEDASQILLAQGPGEPLLILEGGGQKPAAVEGPEQAPFFISFETADIAETADWIRSQPIAVLTEVSEHEWGGIDVIVADADGNPVQIVEYSH